MFAETTGMTSVIVDLITHEGKSPKNMMKGDWVGMSQSRMQRSTPVESAMVAAAEEMDEWTG